MRSLVLVCALTAPAAADVSTSPLEGPFDSRAAACAVVARTGDCTTIQIATKISAKRWGSIEVSSISDHKAKDFALYILRDRKWFAMYLGADGNIDTEIWPPCNGCTTTGCCAPKHYDKPTVYTPPALSFVADQLVMFYATGSDVGFRETAPNGELVQVCRFVSGVPECSEKVIVVPPTKNRIKKPAELFTGSTLTEAPL